MLIVTFASEATDIRISEIVNAGLVPYIMKYARREAFRDQVDLQHLNRLQILALRLTTNLLSGSSSLTLQALSLGIMDPVIEALESEVPDVWNEAAGAVGNVAMDSALLRDSLVQHGVLEKLMMFLLSETNESFCHGDLAESIVIAMKNIYCTVPKLQWLVFQKALPMLTNVFTGSPIIHDNLPLYRETLALLLAILRNEPDVVLVQVIPGLIQVLPLMVRPVLRLIGDLILRDDQYSCMFIHHDGLSCLRFLLETSTDCEIRQTALWCISNLISGSEAFIHRILEANFLPLLIGSTSGLLPHAREACWSLCNIAQFLCAHVESGQALIQAGSIQAYFNFLFLAVSSDLIYEEGSTTDLVALLLTSLTTFMTIIPDLSKSAIHSVAFHNDSGESPKATDILSFLIQHPYLAISTKSTIVLNMATSA